MRPQPGFRGRALSRLVAAGTAIVVARGAGVPVRGCLRGGLRLRAGGMPVGPTIIHGPLAQLAEQRTFNPQVLGSIPRRPTAGPASRRREGRPVRCVARVDGMRIADAPASSGTASAPPEASPGARRVGCRRPPRGRRRLPLRPPRLGRRSRPGGADERAGDDVRPGPEQHRARAGPPRAGGADGRR